MRRDPDTEGGITRRRFTLGGLAAAAAAATAGALSSCSSSKQGSSSAGGTPQVITDSAKITSVLDDYTQATAELEPTATWELPLGTVLFHAQGAWAAAMIAPESALNVNRLAALSLASGKLSDVADSPTRGAGYAFFDVRCSEAVYAWIEMDFTTRSWALMAQGFSAGRLTGEAAQLDTGDESYEPPRFTVSGSAVIWLHMPTATGSRSAESSRCNRWSLGDAAGSKLLESSGRFAASPHLSDGVLTLVPRVLQDKGTYYGLTAFDLSGSAISQRDQLVLPKGVKPFEAVYMDGLFAFSIEAAYGSAGKLGNMGTFFGREGEQYLFLKREPLACPIGNGKRYLVKSQSSHFIIDTDAKTYATLASPDRSLDYGDYPASEGGTDTLLTYATTRNDQGMPGTVTARLFSI